MRDAPDRERADLPPAHSHRRPRVPVVEAPAASPDDTKDEAEALAFGAGRDLERERAQAAHDRAERFQYHLTLGLIAGLWAVVSVVILMGLFYAYHLLLPTSQHFLNDLQVNKVETLLFGSGIGVFLSRYLPRLLPGFER